MAVILQRFSTEISSSGLGRRPLTAETRVRVPVSLPNEAFTQSRVRAFVFLHEPLVLDLAPLLFAESGYLLYLALM